MKDLEPPSEKRFSIEKTPLSVLFLLNITTFIVVTLIALFFLTRR